ncbi:unnamed protein product [Macrosiphum euphorbiae]|uniref:Secreted protein n=1 Tax=Macrosiphum euphorbiae TaxID=13131 RepID=A0AAV0XCM1_9HEMI|nr:unnamed protein product [Macrosiphum euphorbiae]
MGVPAVLLVVHFRHLLAVFANSTYVCRGNNLFIDKPVWKNLPTDFELLVSLYAFGNLHYGHVQCSCYVKRRGHPYVVVAAR